MIELLVVISVIAILIAILMPVLNKAREQVISVLFLNNARQMDLTAVYYTEDNDDKMMPMVIGQGRYASFLAKVINVLGKLYSIEVLERGCCLTCEPFVDTSRSLAITGKFAAKGKLFTFDNRRSLN